MKKSIWIGYDSTNYGQQLAYDVCYRTIRKFNKDISINKLVKKDLEKQNLFNRDDNTGATEFTYTRFLVPLLCNYKGWALFCDSDFLWNCDVNEVFKKYVDNRYAVCCVKHEYTGCHGKFKMDGRKQEWYPRKNWSSLMLFNCEHPDIKKLNCENINKQTPAWLHRMKWTCDDRIGTIDKKYNYLVGYYNDLNIEEIGALHYTDGGPWHPGYENCEYADLWLSNITENEFKMI